MNNFQSQFFQENYHLILPSYLKISFYLQFFLLWYCQIPSHPYPPLLDLLIRKRDETKNKTNKIKTLHTVQTTEIYFLTDLGVGIPRSRCQEVWFLLRSLSLARSWSLSHCVLMYPFFYVHAFLMFFPVLIRASVL